MVNVVSALDRKLLRDLWGIKGQVAAIALVLAAGVATCVMSLSTLESLARSKDAYYERYRFAHVFGHVKRAPKTLAARLEMIPGVAQVQTRIVVDVTLNVPDMVEPAVGRLISVPDFGEPLLNRVHLRRGRLMAPGHSDEVLVGESFAAAHEIVPGDTVTAIINGRQQRLRIVGIVLSPEYIIQVQGGSMLPDDKRFGVFWMNYSGLAEAFDMEGAFNDVCLTLMHGSSEQEVIKRVDDLTEQYGAIGAYDRDDQVSNRYISDEIRQLRTMGIVGPVIFISVATFLLNVVISRMINTQREQIAALKAFGYTGREIRWHYLKLVIAIPLVGLLLGTAVGAWMGRGLTELYTRFYRFPVFSFDLELSVVFLAFIASVTASILGSWAAVPLRGDPAAGRGDASGATGRLPTDFCRTTGIGDVLAAHVADDPAAIGTASTQGLPVLCRNCHGGRRADPGQFLLRCPELHHGFPVSPGSNTRHDVDFRRTYFVARPVGGPPPAGRPAGDALPHYTDEITAWPSASTRRLDGTRARQRSLSPD